MKHFCLFSLLLAASTAASAAVSVEVADGDWRQLPQLSQRGYDHLDHKMQAKLFEIAESKQCPSFLLKQGRLDMRIGFAVQYGTDGQLSRVILPKLGCPEAEGVAGGALLEMLKAGDYAPTGKSPAGWYQGTLGFSFTGANARAPAVLPVQAQPGAVKTADDTEQICEKVEVIGSRLDTKRVCMSRAEWKQRKRADQEQVEKVQMQRGCKYESGC